MTESSASPPRASAYAALATMVVIWAGNFSVAKVALGSVPPLAFNALRFPFAALAVYFVLRSRGRIPLPAREDRWRVVVLGLLGNVLYQQFFTFGLAATDAGIASVLLAGTPILTALLSAMLGHEQVGLGTWLGVAATFGGIVLVVVAGGGLDPASGTIAGGLLMLGASVAWAIYTVGARPLLNRYGAVPVTAWTLWCGTAFLVPIGTPQLLRMSSDALTPATWLAIFYAGALSIGLGYMLWYHGVRVLGNARTAAYSNAVPAVALAIAWLWLNEVPTTGQLVGAAIIIAGVTLAQLRRRRVPSRP